MRSGSALMAGLCLIAVQAIALQSEQPTEPELVSLMQQGGLVLFMRHAATDHSQEDTNVSDLSSCDSQRNLSSRGVAQARAIGEAIESLGIRIGEVYSSPYCRCIDTARNTFGRVSITEKLRASVIINRQQTEQARQFLLDKLSKAPDPGVNRVLISHTSNLREATGIWPKPEGVIHVFRPEGEGLYSHLGMVAPDRWRILAVADNN